VTAVRPLACVTALLAAVSASGCTLQRPEDPVVLTGSQVPALHDVQAGDVVAFRWFNGWDQVPVQVDERKVIDLATVYGPNPPEHVRPGNVATVYADAETWTGPDGDLEVDADDEIALMAKDLGPRRPTEAVVPSGVVAGSGVEVKVRSELGGTPREAWVYLFKRSGSLDPGAGERYVDYNFRLLSGDYKTTFNVAVGSSSPEDSTVTTPFYAAHFPLRWLNDELRVTAGNSSGADILERNKILFYPGECSTNEENFSTGGGAFVANKSGPVRAIRAYLGASSGTFTERDHIFYAQRQDVRSYLRVHQIPGIVDFNDYSRAAFGITYRNNNNQAGVTIDGNPDAVAAGELSWETLNGPQGGLSMVHTAETDIPGLTLTSYYLDDVTPGSGEETQCTGDGEAIGASGPRLADPIPNTEPAFPPSSKVTGIRTIYYDEPGHADGPARAAQAGSQLDVSVSSLP
jgi:hypothetical protein